MSDQVLRHTRQNTSGGWHGTYCEPLYISGGGVNFRVRLGLGGLTRDSFGGVKNGLSGLALDSPKGKISTFCSKTAKTTNFLEESPIRKDPVQKSAIFDVFIPLWMSPASAGEADLAGQGLETPRTCPCGMPGRCTYRGSILVPGRIQWQPWIHPVLHGYQPAA